MGRVKFGWGHVSDQATFSDHMNSSSGRLRVNQFFVMSKILNRVQFGSGQFKFQVHFAGKCISDIE